MNLKEKMQHRNIFLKNITSFVNGRRPGSVTAKAILIFTLSLLLIPAAGATEKDETWEFYSFDSLYRSDGSYHSPEISPDSRWLSVEFQSGDEKKIEILDLQSLQKVSEIALPQEKKKSSWFSLSDDSSHSKKTRFDYQFRWKPLSNQEKKEIPALLWAAFVSGGSEENSDIYLVALRSFDAKPVRYFRLTDHIAVDFEPSWSPDGSSLAFVSGRTGSGDIYITTGIHEWMKKRNSEIKQGLAEKTHISRLTHNAGEDLYPAWSPDGKWIAYSSFSNEPDGSVKNFGLSLIRSSPGNKAIRLIKTENLNELRPSWSHDSNKIACFVPSQPVKMDAFSAGDLNITHDEKIQWSLMVVELPTKKDKQKSRAEFYKIDGDIWPHPFKGPTWFPNQNKIAGIFNDDAGFNALELRIADKKQTSGKQNIIWKQNELITYPEITPDGKKIVFVRQKGKYIGLSMMSRKP